MQLAIALLCLGIYALPVFLPPPPVPLVPPWPDATLSARVFPGVPSWWIWGRLIAVALGAVIAVWGPRGRERATPPPRDRTPAPAGGRWLWLVTGLAIAQAAWAVRALQMGKSEQLAFIFSLLLPAVLTFGLCRAPAAARRAPSGMGPALAIIAVWAVVWFPVAWRSPWIASLVDGSGVLSALVRSQAPDYNFLGNTIRPGQSAMYLVFQGAGIVDWFGFTPTIAYVQIVHGVWIVLCGILVAWAAARLIGPVTAPVAAAAMLAAPFVSVETLFMGPLFIGQLLAAALPLCCLSIATSGSAVAMTLAGLVTGLMATFPSLMSIAYPGLALALVLAWRAPRVPAAAIVTALATFAACVIPILPSLRAMPDLYAFYNSGTSEWATMQNGFFGQLNPDFIRLQLQAGAARPLDALLSSLLWPVAAPRTGLRLWGDVLVDPLSGALAVVGLARCLRAPTARGVGILVLLALALGMGGLSSYDRASLMRLPAAPVPVALLAAIGFRALAGRRPERALRAGSVITSLCIVAAGWIVMVVVNPRILPRSATGIAIEATAPSEVAGAVALLPYGWDPQSSPLYLDSLPATPIKWVSYRDAADFDRPDGVGPATLLFWSPGLEERAAVATAVCAKWPSARLYDLTDAAGLSHAFAATPDGRAWTPTLPASQWHASDCVTELPTEGRAAAVAIATARQQVAAGQIADALATLRTAARASVLQSSLFDELARLLLTTGKDATAVEEAAMWAHRAVTTSGYCLPGSIATLLQAYNWLGRADDIVAVKAAERAAHKVECANLPIGHPYRLH